MDKTYVFEIDSLALSHRKFFDLSIFHRYKVQIERKIKKVELLQFLEIVKFRSI